MLTMLKDWINSSFGDRYVCYCAMSLDDYQESSNNKFAFDVIF